MPEVQPSAPAGDLRHELTQIAELAGGLAHELRNPLSTMMINLKLLAEELQNLEAQPADTRRRALLKVDVLRREAERLQVLFEEFLNLTGQRTLERRPIDLNLIVARLVEFCEPLMKAHHVRVRVVAGAPSVMCVADEKLLSQALLNIVINAQQAMPGGGEISIATALNRPFALVSVRDTGVGIAEADRERILRPFFSTKARGTGLGLSITQRIVHEHGGTLTLCSEVSKGTTFMIRLPSADRA
jgi:signal transduction histidine kinase